jgi:hypothetical protein
MFEDLNEDNFIMYAMKAYISPHCILTEFNSDLKRTKYLKRLFRRYKITKTLKERLILNHLILLYNVFGTEAATRILFFKIDEKDYDILKTFLIYLNFMPEKIKGIKGVDILSSNILIDMNVADILRKI